ncbi:unnamed protein product [Litomosoides sigmodontis]|uniref:Uncharacterized protein n=1 Tax=Litomosoides sigmodontis TaxID=42156 RepID=A0A3P6TXC7_LITSI|nr:unnamed protein product [Litomosoides sigmodontis]
MRCLKRTASQLSRSRSAYSGATYLLGYENASSIHSTTPPPSPPSSPPPPPPPIAPPTTTTTTAAATATVTVTVTVTTIRHLSFDTLRYSITTYVS